MQLYSPQTQFGGFALPDFVIIGAQKSATTSLLSYVGQHPEVKLGWKKATHYFDLQPKRSRRWYAWNFPLAGNPLGVLTGKPSGRQWLTGESCPAYMFLPEVPERVRKTIPQAKLIVILRDPVWRLVSQYFHQRRKQRVPVGFSDYVAESIDIGWPPPGDDLETVRQRHAVPRGYYEDQIRHWLQFFPREQFCILRFEDLIADSAATMNRIFRFLGLDGHPVDTSRVLNKGIGAKENEALDADLLRRLDDLYRKRNAGLASLIGGDFSYWQRTGVLAEAA